MKNNKTGVSVVNCIMKRAALALGLVWVCVYANVVLAAIDVHEFKNDEQRLRYQSLITELRCPKCQNQNLEDSNSQIAIDLRNSVYRLLVIEEQTDEQIKRYLVNRYGDFVLYRPPVQANTLVLWWAPVVMLGLGVVIFIIIVVRRRSHSADGALQDSDNQ